MDSEVPGYRLAEPVREDRDLAASPGGSARVWRAVRASDGAAVAAKVVHRADADRLRREADLARAVGHPHVLAPLDVVVGGPVAALVTPWAAGGSLAALLTARHRLRWTETLTVLIPLADALAAAHERGIVHGDLSSANVLLDGDGRPLLADLGAARAAGELGGPVAVTPTDVAPEIARGGTPSPAADLFSLGSIALRCLSGRPAWPAQDLQDVLICSTAGQWPDPDEMMGPPGLLGIVRRLLDPDPSRRGSAAQAAVELRRAGDPEPIELEVRRPDGTVGPPAPATIVRDGAARPPGLAGARHRPRAHRRRAGSGRRRRIAPAPPARVPGRHHRRGRWPHAGGGRWQRAGVGRGHRGHRVRSDRRPGRGGRWRRSRAVVVAGLVVMVIGWGAVRAGLWWADGAGAKPLPAAPMTAHPAADQAARPAGPAPERSSQASARSGPASAAAAAQPAGRSPSDADWLTVVAALDAARASAFTARDPGRLDAVYTADAPARAADAERIAAMIDADRRVTAAGHRVESAALLEIADRGVVTVRVVESLPSYPVLDGSGAVVGSTAPAASSVVVLHLRPTEGGFRIAAVTRA